MRILEEKENKRRDESESKLADRTQGSEKEGQERLVGRCSLFSMAIVSKMKKKQSHFVQSCCFWAQTQ